MPKIRTLLVLSLLCSALQISAVDARGNSSINKRQAIAIATAKYPGKVIKVVAGEKRYRVRVLQKSGRVITVKINKTTGKIIR